MKLVRNLLLIILGALAPVALLHAATAVPDGWAFLKVRSAEVPTISPDFLERERREMAPDLYAQEYEAEFALGGGRSLFSLAQIDSLILEEPA